MRLAVSVMLCGLVGCGHPAPVPRPTPVPAATASPDAAPDAATDAAPRTEAVPDAAPSAATTGSAIQKFRDDRDDGDDGDSAGDPYLAQLGADARADFSPPATTTTGAVAVACVHLAADGTVSEITFKAKTGSADFDAAVERALRSVQRKRNASPTPVPPHLLQLTRQWLCFRFTDAGV